MRKSLSSTNEYFDLQCQYFESGVKEIWVMDAPDSAHFEPLKLMNISTTSNGTLFLNESSQVTTSFPNQCQFTCRLDENTVSSICDVLKRNEGQFNVLSQIV